MFTQTPMDTRLRNTSTPTPGMVRKYCKQGKSSLFFSRFSQLCTAYRGHLCLRHRKRLQRKHQGKSAWSGPPAPAITQVGYCSIHLPDPNLPNTSIKTSSYNIQQHYEIKITSCLTTSTCVLPTEDGKRRHLTMQSARCHNLKKEEEKNTRKKKLTCWSTLPQKLI